MKYDTYRCQRGDFMISKQDYDNLLIEVKKEFSDFEIINKKNSNLMLAIDKFLRIITFGKMNRFMTDFITTIGNKVYVPADWDKNSPATNSSTIRHERVHMRQNKKYGRFLFSLSYVLFPMPTLFAYFRTKFEMEAYEETLRTVHEYYGPKVFTPGLRENIINLFVGPEYFWMWMRKKDIEKWYDSTVEKIINSNNSNMI